MVRGGLLLIAISACGFSGGGVDPQTVDGGNSGDGGSAADAAPPAEDWFGDYAFRKRITIAPEITAPLSDFPVAILLEGDADLTAAGITSSSEIAFTAADGLSPLAFELENFAADTGTLAAWVNVSSLPITGTSVYIYFSDPNASSLEDLVQTWAGPFTSVWHLSQNPTGSSPQFTDSVGGNHGSSSGGGIPNRVIGAHGAGLLFDGSSDNVNAGDPANLDFGLNSFSYSVWVNVTTSVGDFDFPMWKGGTAMVNVGYAWVCGTGQWNASVSDGTGPSTRAVVGTEDEFTGRWVHLAAVIDRANNEFRAYADGTERAVVDITNLQSLDTDREMQISQSFARFNGVVDEMRVYDEALTAEWIKTEFDNIESDSFISIEPVEANPGAR